MTKPKLSKTFAEYWSLEMKKKICSDISLLSPSRVDLVWDLYFDDSLKREVRENRGIGVRRQVHANAPVQPSTWISFLRNSTNKENLYKFLAHCALSSLQDVLVVTNVGDVIVSSTADGTSLSGVSCQSQEEADGRIMKHVADAARQGILVAVIRSVDSDVFAIAVSHFHDVQSFGLSKLWIWMGVGQKTRFIPVHSVAASLGPAHAVALRGFHSFSGCDTCSSFALKGKKNLMEIF